MLDYFVLAAKEENQKERVCAEYLRRYNEGLILSNTIRMCDALMCLNKFHEEQRKKKLSIDDEQNIQITDTERFLFDLFKGDVILNFLVVTISTSNYACNNSIVKVKA